MFSSRPFQALRHDCWRARPYEKVSFQGLGPGAWLISLSASDASSSDMPPERKVTPGTAHGVVRCRTRTVACAISLAVACTLASEPERTMFGFRRVPSRRTW